MRLDAARGVFAGKSRIFSFSVRIAIEIRPRPARRGPERGGLPKVGRKGYCRAIEKVGMKTSCAVFCLWTGLAALAARGEDLVTLTGQTFSNIEVREVKWDSLLVKHDTGISKVFLAEIPADRREHYKQMEPPPAPPAAAIPVSQEPAGSNDLATLTGLLYRNVAVRRVEKDGVLISHDGGLAKIFFSEMSDEQRAKCSAAPRPISAPPPGTNDLVAADGQIYRNVRVRRIEPDALTFRHDGGVTRVPFELLPADVQKKYEYDPQAAAAYQRAVAEAQAQAERDRLANRAQNDAARRKQIQSEPIRVSNVSSLKIGAHQYRVRFSVRNYDDKPREITAVASVFAVKHFTVPGNYTMDGVEIVSDYPAKSLAVRSGSYSTSHLLSW